MKRPWMAAAGTAALTSLLFAVVYNVCNRVTHLRPDVGVWAFSWERYWPFIPAMIVPYWSIDAFFVASPFFCKTLGELATHRRRIVFAIIAGGIGFLAIPLRFAFPRPHPTGMFAPWFGALYGFDLPHNLFPSLHIALRTLLASLYVRKCPGPVMRWVTHAWFSLVGISTLLTWQHHLVDVIGGFWLGAIAIHLHPFDEIQDGLPPRAANPRIAFYYGLGAFGCSQLARIAWPWTFVLVWPAFAFGVAAFGYAGFGGRIYRKRDGRLTWPTRILLFPMLAGQWLSLLHYRRQSPRWNEITPRVWIGALPNEKDARDAIAAGVTCVLDLTVEFSEVAAFRKLNYYNLQVLDLTAPSREQFAQAVEIIARESARGIVFVHCKAGYSRSAGAVGVWLLASHSTRTVEETISRIQSARPGVVIRPEIRDALRAFAAKEGSTAVSGENPAANMALPD